MASGFLFIDGRDPDSVFSSGNAGITTGLLHSSSGTDLGNLYISGNSGIVTGLLSSSGTDIGSLFGTGGTLPIQGQVFTAVPTTAGASSSANLFFSTNNSTWSVYDPNNGGSGAPLASGSIPSAAAKVQFSATLTAGTTATNFTNQASSVTTLTGTQIFIQTGNAVVGGGHASVKSTYSIQVQYQNSAGSAISTTTFTFVTNTNPT